MLDIQACEDVLEAARDVLDSLIFDPSGQWCIVDDEKLGALRNWNDSVFHVKQ